MVSGRFTYVGTHYTRTDTHTISGYLIPYSVQYIVDNTAVYCRHIIQYCVQNIIMVSGRFTYVGTPYTRTDTGQTDDSLIISAIDTFKINFNVSVS